MRRAVAANDVHFWATSFLNRLAGDVAVGRADGSKP